MRELCENRNTSEIIEKMSRAKKSSFLVLAVVLSMISCVLRIDIALPTKKVICSWVGCSESPSRREFLKLKDNVQLKSYELWLIN